MFHFPPPLIILQVLAIDISLDGDNAIVVGMAAAGLPTKERHKAVYAGIAIAAVLRIILAVFAVQLLHVTGLLAAGGLLLLWVGWKMFRELRAAMRKAESDEDKANRPPPPAKKLSDAIIQIAIADLSMSLDNVLAVAGAARNHPSALIFGLVLSVILMGIAAEWVARLTARHKWVGWVGVVIIIYTAGRMIYEGGHDIMQAMV